MYSLFISQIQTGVLYFTWQPTFPVLPPNPKEHFPGGGKELTAQHLSKAAHCYAAGRPITLELSGGHFLTERGQPTSLSRPRLARQDWALAAGCAGLTIYHTRLSFLSCLSMLAASVPVTGCLASSRPFSSQYLN